MSGDSTQPRRPVMAWLVAGAILAGVLVRLHIGLHMIDDAFITFRYSHHIANGQGFTFNPPQHVLGTSTPLFALILAVLARFGADLPRAAFGIALLADVAAMALAASVLIRLGYAFAAVLLTVALALAPAVVIYSVSGMETSLYTALIVAVIWCVQRERWLTASVVGGLAWFCRPDGVLLAAAMIAAALLVVAWRRAASLALVVAAVMAPWVIFATWYFGSAVPMSVAAKADLAKDPLAGLRVAKAFFLSGPDLAASAIAVAGAVLLWRSRSRAARLWLAWGAVYTAVFAVSRAFDGYGWYFTPLMPLYFGAIAVAIDAAVRRWAGDAAAARPRPTTLVAASAALSVFVACGAVRLSQANAEMARTQSIREDLYKAFATSLAASGERCALAAQEIGALGYYYPGPIVDLVGLTTPEAIGRPRGDVLRTSAACWLVAYDNSLDALDRTLFAAPWFSEEFRLVTRTVVSPTRALVIYRRTSTR